MISLRIQFLVVLLLPMITVAQQNDTVSIIKTLNEVSIIGHQAGKTTPMAFTDISEEELEKINLGKDLPYLISLTPSIIASSDAGNGIGYTYMTLRGSDASRINVTINGIPLNDAESQGVWWVNMPDFTSSVNKIQIQRGVGTSTNGGSAFGGTINLQTNVTQDKKYLTHSSSLGSYNSFKNNIEFGTGLLNQKFSFNGRISQIQSGGYIDRASSSLKSFYLSAGYYGESSSLKAIAFSGNERTYQAWYGVPKIFLDTIPTFNPYDYEDEVDDYTQTHFQLHYSKQISKIVFNVAAHYTKGAGYYEQYRGDKYNALINYGAKDFLLDYGLHNVILNNDTIRTTNLVRRKWLDNDFYGMTFSFNYTTNNLSLIVGGAANTYLGDHFGRVVWSELYSNMNHEYYKNEATKHDQNIYWKINYNVRDKIHLFADLQARNINYSFEGLNDDGSSAQQKVEIPLFLNPKFGLFYKVSDKTSFYTSFSVGNKEPNRNDYVESSPSSRPKHETLYDTEIGFKHRNKELSFGINLYNMRYRNQLINTGEINDVGYSVHSNIPDSYRKGIEIESTIKLTNKLIWNGNITVSKNKILSHTEYVDNWDTGIKEEFEYENTDIAFSPNIISSSQLHYNIKNLNISYTFQYVGKQYLDNSQSKERMLNPYAINNLLCSYSLNFKKMKQVRLTLQINNIFNNQYSNRAWAYRFNSSASPENLSYDPYINEEAEGHYNMIGYFPQAGRNYMLGMSLGF